MGMIFDNIKEEIRLNGEYYRRQKILSFKPKRCEVPRGTSAKIYSYSVLREVREYAFEINRSKTPEEFSNKFCEIKNLLEELAWLNEKKNVFMYPTPRANFEQIISNIENTINDLIVRSILQIRGTDEEWASQAENFLNEIEGNEIIKALCGEKNEERIEEIRNQIILRRNRATKQAISEKAVQKKKKEKPIDIEKIMQEEQAWRREQKGLSPIEFELQKVDSMEGYAFEYWCAELLKTAGYVRVKVTQESNDQGVDILAEKDGVRYAIQCKCYSSDVGNTPIQEVTAGKMIYKCHVGVVMTNRYFTDGGKSAAEATGTLLWDRDKLIELLKQQ